MYLKHINRKPPQASEQDNTTTTAISIRYRYNGRASIADMIPVWQAAARQAAIAAKWQAPRQAPITAPASGYTVTVYPYYDNTAKQAPRRKQAPAENETVKKAVTAYAKLKRAAETMQAADVQALSIATVYAVLKKLYDVSGNDLIRNLKISLPGDIASLKNGLSDVTISDAYDLVQEACKAYYEEYGKACNRYGKPPAKWLDMPYETSVLNKRVIIANAGETVNRPAYKTVSISPIQMMFRAVRDYIGNSRTEQINNRYIYLADVIISPDGLEDTIYRRLNRVDVGSYEYDFSRKETFYTADKSYADKLDELIRKLNPSKVELQVLKLRLQGLGNDMQYGKKAIASYLHVSPQRVKNILKILEDKAAKNGVFSPNVVEAASIWIDEL